MDEKKAYTPPHVEIENGKVKRKYTSEWGGGPVQVQNLTGTEYPKVINTLSKQREAMKTYIEQLHDKIDELLKEKGA